MTVTFIIKFILVILSVTLADICWAKYMHWAAQKHPLKAGLWSVLIISCGIFSFVSYMEDHRLIPAAMIGAFIGTYLAVAHSKSKG
jgi:hypothetical protein